MPPDFLIDSLIGRLIDACTASLAFYSELPESRAVFTRAPLIFPIASLHSSFSSRTLASGFFFFSSSREWRTPCHCIPDTINHYAAGIESSCSFTRQHVNLFLQLLRVKGHCFFFFSTGQEDASFLNRFQMELNLEPFKG